VSKKRGKSQSKLAGLVGGDSDSSALTQESGDEAQGETPRESVVTGTDGGTEDGEEEDVEMQEAAASSRSSILSCSEIEVRTLTSSSQVDRHRQNQLGDVRKGRGARKGQEAARRHARQQRSENGRTVATSVSPVSYLVIEGYNLFKSSWVSKRRL
jgi:hypothetical protein